MDVVVMGTTFGSRSTKAKFHHEVFSKVFEADEGFVTLSRRVSGDAWDVPVTQCIAYDFI
ncbi:uncharacterized protein PHALS_04498 [Plasmopara halstedii]|uniref:Uncharacterized protein n=1 Tax=Plasmopara halstedii TaxID=4781 RepID=A0A0P1A9H4_PLAHL|nr:uncharacterized protein PHALS_04498 [Plasmopara halstedii]CEG37034.1 hypothetical protein PHALS_04498 [Plasmopara halstedii]|eukprot:XP_024573403.1 hypothetical protein PHALS_04498 [Plasmopara halstedii]